MTHIHSYDAPGVHKAIKLHILEAYLLAPHLPRNYTLQQLDMMAAPRVRKGVDRTEQSSRGDGLELHRSCLATDEKAATQEEAKIEKLKYRLHRHLQPGAGSVVNTCYMLLGCSGRGYRNDKNLGGG